MDISKKNRGGLIETNRFASISAQKSQEQSRIEDFINLGYSMVYLNKRCLPWIGIHSVTSDKVMERVLKIKKADC